MPLRLALGVRKTVAGHRLGTLEEGGGGYPPPSDATPGGGQGGTRTRAVGACGRCRWGAAAGSRPQAGGGGQPTVQFCYI